MQKLVIKDQILEYIVEAMKENPEDSAVLYLHLNAQLDELVDSMTTH